MKTITMRQLLVGFALLLVALAVVWLFQRPPLESRPAPGEAAVDLRWREGARQQYQVRFDSFMQMNMAGGNAGQGMHVQMHALLNLQTLEVEPSGDAQVGMRLADVQLQVNGESDQATNQAMGAAFRVHYTAGGIPESFEFPAQVTAQDRDMLENLVRTFQVTMDEGHSWVARELNASGSFEAAYRRTAPSQVEKTKRDFSGMPSAEMLAGATIESRETIHLDPQRDWITEMVVSEILQTQGQGGNPAMVINNHASLKLQPIAQAVDVDNWNFVAAAAPAEDSPAPVPAISPAEARRQILAALPQLDAITHGRITWIHRLRDLLRVDESLPAVLLEQLKTETLSDRTRADLYLAFELAGTEAAQTALVSVLHDQVWSSRDAMRAIVALAGVDEPSAETIEALWNTAQTGATTGDQQQLASTATFALGSIGNTLHAADNPGYSGLRDQLLSSAFASSGSDYYAEQRTNYVHALGNTRDASLATDLLNFLEDDAPEVRRAAALSLGMVGTDQAGEELISHFEQERNSQVRGAIAESLASWTQPSQSAVTTIRSAIHTERDENTRLGMARFLATNLDTFPENRETLQQLLRTEQSKRIRQSVAEALAESK
ncbi:MAG: HEAT repeat domain-containing protein [Cellvibrionaceae bacterium]